MSYLCAMLLMVLSKKDAFRVFSHLIKRPLQCVFIRSDMEWLERFYGAFEDLLKQYAPKIAKHFLAIQLSPSLYLPGWCMTAFSSTLPLNISMRIWDMFLYWGEVILIRTSLALLKSRQAEVG